ncbi:isopropylmalate isomerase large subunit [Caballeronia choica]|jgi:3-isopropylmalate/(R)-2-methylmalate dehydratase large subunit|uniref:3-isopropylmalate dehydratase n=2 Tax=Caballeronia choica TaxID=326476 RepID=A0A158K6F1_9BURK|nr:isopropylmalate isomerase large subunit [Caballeronia choica]
MGARYAMRPIHSMYAVGRLYRFGQTKQNDLYVRALEEATEMTHETPRSLFEKVWDAHVVASRGSDAALLHVDRHLVHDLSGGEGLYELKARGLKVRNPELTIATPDHTISTTPGRADTIPVAQRLLRDFRTLTNEAGIRLFDVDTVGQGIVHVIGPELGLSLPGSVIVCADSHTCTHGGLGALAFGIGTSEMQHVFATQTIVQRQPRLMRVVFVGKANGITAKDMVLHLIGRIGAGAGSGFAVEYSGEAVQALEVEARLTLCNLSIELGAKVGMVAPDDVTIEYLAGRPFAPAGPLWDEALKNWHSLKSDEGAAFDREVLIDISNLAPQITWGTSPQDVIDVSGTIPDPQNEKDPKRRQEMIDALKYIGLEPGQRIEGTPVDVVFIGSCTNSRLSDLREAAKVARRGKVAPGVKAWVVPGSESVKRAAEAEGLNRVFTDAGFEWRSPGCSMCLAVNGETVGPGQRSVSTSNRNFVGRQGPRARTHLASPAMAAAAALAGCIVDVRKQEQ